LARERLGQGQELDLGALELGLRRALLQDGRRLLEDLLAYAASLYDRTTPAQSDEKIYHGRARLVETVLGPVRLARAYFHCAARGAGRAPFDEALGLIEGYSPGLAGLMCRIAAQQSFEPAAADLLAYAGLTVEGRAIQRLVHLLGPQMRATRAARPEPSAPSPVTILYLSADGTGIPMMRRELAGRKGRQPDGSARTREVKLGCVFTQQTTDDEGHPLRDPDSTTYLGTLENAEAFGLQLRQEASRRGLAQAPQTVFLGDGAAWVWEQARINFPQAVCILDFYHACEHLATLAAALWGAGDAAKEHARRWAHQMKAGGIAQILSQAQEHLTQGAATAPEAAEKELAYFRKNESRMRYAEFARRGFFIGSGVVEAGCRTVIGQRLKRSGMFWSEEGAQNIITLRCALLGHHFDADWADLTARSAA
jgi:hypothetical protein